MTVMGSWSAHGYGFFSVIEKSSGEWVGRLGPWQPEGWPGTEVGWGIKESEAGKGYASEGAAAAIRWAFEHLGWSEVIHTIAEDNVTSKRVAEKLGSRYLRMGRMAEPYDKVLVEIWGQSRHDWESNSPTVGMSEAG
jgi:RimJ/RimL family protein N-acetyltransferase